MNSPRKPRDQWLTAAGLVTPVLLVLFARGALNWQPRASTAAQPTLAQPGEPAATAPRSAKDQAAALAYLDSRPQALASRSPMTRPRAQAAPAPAPTAAPAVETTPEFTISSVLGGNSPAAIINSRVCRVGTEVSPGWFVRAIDAQTITATIQGPAGRTLTVSKMRKADQPAS